MTRILAIDYGRKRIGLALSDPLGLSAQPLDAVAADPRSKALAAIASLLEARQVTQIILGHPLSMNGQPGPMAQEVSVFKEALEKHVQVPVTLVDERLSSKEAERTLIDGDVRRNKRRQYIDSMAASIFLQTYLETHRTRDA